MSYTPHFRSVADNAWLVNKLSLIEEEIKIHVISQHLMHIETYTKQNKIMKMWLNTEFFLSLVFDALSQEKHFLPLKIKAKRTLPLLY